MKLNWKVKTEQNIKVYSHQAKVEAKDLLEEWILGVGEPGHEDVDKVSLGDAQ